MKKWLPFFFLVLQYTSMLNAQTNTPSIANNDSEIRKATELLTEKYALNADQAKQMYTIQLRKAKNMTEIASFQNTDPSLYRAKLQNIQKGTIASIGRILNTETQVKLYHKTQADLRILRNQKQKEMAGQNTSRAEIETALLAIYAE